MIRNINEAKPGSACDTWRKAGAEWRAQTWSTGPGALLIAANAYASGRGLGENWRDTIKRAFIEGAAI
jgi:hypothetical protein